MEVRIVVELADKNPVCSYWSVQPKEYYESRILQKLLNADSDVIFKEYPEVLSYTAYLEGSEICGAKNNLDIPKYKKHLIEKLVRINAPEEHKKGLLKMLKEGDSN